MKTVKGNKKKTKFRCLGHYRWNPPLLAWEVTADTKAIMTPLATAIATSKTRVLHKPQCHFKGNNLVYIKGNILFFKHPQ